MKIFGFNIGTEKRANNTEEILQYSPFSEALLFGSNLTRTNSMSLSAVYRATELISDSIAVLPIRVNVRDEKGHKEELQDHPLNMVFQDKTGSFISKYTLMKLLIQSVILKGNGFAYIERGKDGSVKGIRFIESSDVTINYDKNKNTLTYTCNTISRSKIEPINMIHLIKNSYDGVNGVSVLSYATRTLGIANSTENQCKDFFDSGCNLSGMLTVQGQLSEKQKQDIRTSWSQAYSGGGKGLAVLQGNMTFAPIQVSASDSQMLESRLYNVQDIARFFGISPVMLGDLSHSSYSTLEATQLDFYAHTLQPYIVMVENEFNRKLLKPSEANLVIDLDDSYVLKSDKTTQAAYYTQLLSNGVLSVNEVRKELGYSEIEGGDSHTIPYTDISQNTLENEKDSEGQ